VTQPVPRQVQPVGLRVEPEQDLGHGQADQLGIGEARRLAGTAASFEADEEVIDGDVPCRDEGVELGLHLPLLGALALLVTACFPSIANSDHSSSSRSMGDQKPPRNSTQVLSGKALDADKAKAPSHCGLPVPGTAARSIPLPYRRSGPSLGKL